MPLEHRSFSNVQRTTKVQCNGPGAAMSMFSTENGDLETARRLPAMNCPACGSEIDDRSYRCKVCRQVSSYRRLGWRYRYLLLLLLAFIGYWTLPGLVRRWFARDYDKLPVGALVSDQITLSRLGLTDKGWFCEEPHYKGNL